MILPGSGGTLAPLPSAGERVLQIFQAVLESPHMNADDHFFWSGATSLQALEACARLETWLGARVPLTLLQEHPTARQFFEHLPGRDPVGEARHLLRLVEGEQPGAILMMPDTDLREILVCELTRRLPPGPPVYSFRHDGYRTGALPPRSLPSLAREFAQDMTRAGLRGPLRIFGHCYGGFLGWELASQLEKQGVEVALVLLSDSWIPHWAREPGGKWEEVRRRAAKVKERALGDLREGGGLRGAWNSAQDELEKLRRNPLHDWLETSSGKEAFGGEGTPGTAMAARFADAIDLWVPERIRAPVVCGIAETWDPDPSYEYALETPEGPERRKAWLELTDGPGEVVTLPGRHSELFHTPELLDEAAAQLGEIFARYR